MIMMQSQRRTVKFSNTSPIFRESQNKNCFEKHKRKKTHLFLCFYVTFFMVMMLKKIHRFKAMEIYAKQNYEWFGGQKPPSRKTIRTLFEKLASDIERFVPIALACMDLSPAYFSFKVSFVDKFVFCVGQPLLRGEFGKGCPA
jgi:hypothetical protein